MSVRKLTILEGLFRMKCPNCRRGNVFVNKSIFPLTKTMKMENNCPVCQQKLISESNNGGGINYALTVMLFFLNLLWYWPIFGMSYKDNSIFYYLFTSIFVVVLAQPWLMRLSRMLYLYMYIPYGSGTKIPEAKS